MQAGSVLHASFTSSASFLRTWEFGCADRPRAGRGRSSAGLDGSRRGGDDHAAVPAGAGHGPAGPRWGTRPGTGQLPPRAARTAGGLLFPVGPA